jgi:hypothetical protein
MTYLKALRRVAFPVLFLCASTSLALLAVAQDQMQTLHTDMNVHRDRLGYIYSQIGRLNQTTWGLSARVNYLGGNLAELTQVNTNGLNDLASRTETLRQVFIMLIYALRNQTAPAA